MMRSFACFFCLVLVGCDTLKTIPPPAEHSGLRYLGAEAYITVPTSPNGGAPLFKKDVEFNALFESEDLCGVVPQRFPEAGGADWKLAGAPVVAILIAISSAAINYYEKSRQIAIAKRYEASRQGGDAQIVTSPDRFMIGRCLVYSRRAQDERKDARDLVVVLKIERPAGQDNPLRAAGSSIPDHFTLRPIFARMYNSISQTKVGGDVTLAIGITLQQIHEEQGIPRLAILGLVDTEVQSVPLSGEVQCRGEDKCRSSSVLPVPTNDGTIVLGIGVREIGDLGFNVDLAKAQVEAIAGALGPLSGSLIQGHFDREKVRNDR